MCHVHKEFRDNKGKRYQLGIVRRQREWSCVILTHEKTIQRFIVRTSVFKREFKRKTAKIFNLPPVSEKQSKKF